MKKVQKRFSPKILPNSGIAMDLKTYRKTQINTNQSSNHNDSLQAPLSQVFTVAAFMMSPFAVQSQCLVSPQSIDLNRDGVMDLFIYSTFRSNGYAGAIRSINQVRARALNPNDNVTFFGTQFFPRSCYVYSCVFPTPDGALSGVNMGSVAVLNERINSCQRSYVQSKNTFTFTNSGNVYTSCSFFTFTTYVCNPTLINGNFAINTPGTLGFEFRGEPHFVELTLTPTPTIQKIDGAIAQPCDSGCQDVLELTCNEVFPIESYYAENAIETNDIVDMSQMVELAAGVEIEMLPGFEVIQGGELLAEIDPNCN